MVVDDDISNDGHELIDEAKAELQAGLLSCQALVEDYRVKLSGGTSHDLTSDLVDAGQA